MADVAEQCQVPVVVAGGSRMPLLEVFRSVEAALRGGAAGTAIGRNVLTSADPLATQRAILQMVHENATAEVAIQPLADSVAI
jgi:DhnA family fructose-bisphosphate aldolase class Ia